MTACMLSSKIPFSLLLFIEFWRIVWWRSKNNIVFSERPSKNPQNLPASGKLCIFTICKKPIVWDVKTVAEKGKTWCLSQQAKQSNCWKLLDVRDTPHFLISQGIYERKWVGGEKTIFLKHKQKSNRLLTAGQRDAVSLEIQVNFKILIEERAMHTWYQICSL